MSQSNAVVRDAATVVLLREAASPGGKGGGEPEVLMLLRSSASSFVGGVYVFPGGAVDPSDAEAAILGRCVGLDDRAASAALSIDSGGLALFVAALRECFEESGLLLARSRKSARAGSPDLGELSARARLAERRGALNEGRLSFSDFLEEEDLELLVGDLVYFSRWVTPEGAPRRYDTRFFVAEAPHGQEATPDNAETIDSRWVIPSEALAQHRAGSFNLVFPTIKTLEALSGSRSVEEILLAARNTAEIATVAPRVVHTPEGDRLVLPGEPGYAAGGGLRRGSPLPGERGGPDYD